MITSTSNTFQGYTADGATIQVSTYFGLNSDTKPTDDTVGNGSAFVEMNTGKLYFYDAENSEWKEWA